MKQVEMKRIAFETIKHEIETANETMYLDRAEGMQQLANKLGLLSEKQNATLSEMLDQAFNKGF